MSLDGIVTHALVRELQILAGGRISKIYQPSEHDLVLTIRAQSATMKLIISANPTYPRIHISDSTFINPLEAPMFCMLMRKHMEGGIIETVSQVGSERIIHLDVRHRDELGDISIKRMVIEIMGRHSNIILTDPKTGNVVDGIHHVTPAISAYRIVMPGQPYTSPPEQHKLSPFEPISGLQREEPDKEEGEDKEQSESQTAVRQLVDALSGVSPLLAREAVFRSGYSLDSRWSEVEPFRVWSSYADMMAPVADGHFLPQIRIGTDQKSYFSVVDLTHISGEVRYFNTVSACLEAYFGDKAERDLVKQRVSDLTKLMENEKNKNIKKIKNLKKDYAEAQGADRYRIYGELLTASLHLMNRGEQSIEVINYYDESQAHVEISLDPQLTPSENAQRYFKKYSKYKNSLAVIEEQIRLAEEEILYIENVLHQLSHAVLTDIEEIREELGEQGYVRNRKHKAGKKKKKSTPMLACYTSAEGIPIYVGKNNKQNDYLTNRVAHSSDTWLHTKDIPGSHVVIRSGNFGDDTLREAAQLAAYFSQARSSSQVPVDYTQIRHVHKPNGAKPGFVIYDNQRTLFVTPDEDMIRQMPATLK